MDTTLSRKITQLLRSLRHQPETRRGCVCDVVALHVRKTMGMLMYLDGGEQMCAPLVPLLGHCEKNGSGEAVGLGILLAHVSPGDRLFVALASLSELEQAGPLVEDEQLQSLIAMACAQARAVPIRLLSAESVDLDALEKERHAPAKKTH